MIHGARLGQERERGKGQRLFHEITVSKAGVDDDRNLAPIFSELFQGGGPVQIRHGQIEHNDIGRDNEYLNPTVYKVADIVHGALPRLRDLDIFIARAVEFDFLKPESEQLSIAG